MSIKISVVYLKQIDGRIKVKMEIINCGDLPTLDIFSNKSQLPRAGFVLKLGHSSYCSEIFDDAQSAKAAVGRANEDCLDTMARIEDRGYQYETQYKYCI